MDGGMASLYVILPSMKFMGITGAACAAVLPADRWIFENVRHL